LNTFFKVRFKGLGFELKEKRHECEVSDYHGKVGEAWEKKRPHPKGIGETCR
jgi:hypothetical protein